MASEDIRGRLDEARAIIAEGRQSHVAWRDHLAACPGCEECRKLGIDWSAEREDEWVTKYDTLRQTVRDALAEIERLTVMGTGLALDNVRLAAERDALQRTLWEHDSHGPEGRNVTNLQFHEMRDRALEAERQLAEHTKITTARWKVQDQERSDLTRQLAEARGAHWHQCQQCEYEWREDRGGDECPICTLIEAHIQETGGLKTTLAEAQAALAELLNAARMLAAGEYEVGLAGTEDERTWQKAAQRTRAALRAPAEKGGEG